MIALTTEKIIENFKEVHGSTYDYSHVSYKTAKDKVTIICKIHGEFQQLPQHHTKGSGCRLCANKLINLTNGKSYTQDKFIEIALSKNIPNLTYDKVIYKGKRENIIITCNIHGDYTTKAEIILKGNGCKQCASNKLKIDRISNKEEFITKSVNIHGNLYNYDLVNYQGSFIKVDILCKKHNKIFKQTPAIHLKDSGCPLCKSSKGELSIISVLENNNISFKTQHTYKDLIFERRLKFDFYLIDYNACIEFDGEQHFKALKSNHWRGEEGFKRLQLKDSLKDEYCKIKNIPLLRIKYDNINISHTIRDFILSLQKKE